ncbi:MAG: hypothetical protein IPN15_14490, partial [Saprospiraceae bacterium]|nr:hypothetical protein [Candidatus Vicinibacter affinis]
KIKEEKKETAEEKKKLAKKTAKEKAKAKARAKEKAKKNAKKKKGSSSKSTPKKNIEKTKDSPATESNSNSSATETYEEIATPKKTKTPDVTNVGSKLVPTDPPIGKPVIWSAKNLTDRGKYYEARDLLNPSRKIQIHRKNCREIYTPPMPMFTFVKKITAMQLLL